MFNPSNIGLVVAFLVLGSTRVEPLDFWWAPLDARMIAGLRRHPHRRGADHAPPATSSPLAATFWVVLAASVGLLAASGHCMVARWAFAPVCGFDFWWVIVTSPEVLIFLFFMITDPKTLPPGASAASSSARAGGRRHAPHGATDERVRDQGRPARRPRDRVRLPPAPRAAGAGAHRSDDDARRFATRLVTGGRAAGQPVCPRGALSVGVVAVSVGRGGRGARPAASSTRRRRTCWGGC